MTRAPIPGHISSLRAAEQEQKRKDTLKDASKKHIDPFTGKRTARVLEKCNFRIQVKNSSLSHAFERALAVQ